MKKKATLIKTFLAVLIAPALLNAQAVTASILGVAHDETGAVVPRVQVTATNLDTNQISETATDQQGQYRFLSLPIGRYKVEATLQGFDKFIEDNVVLTVNEQRRVDLNMRVGTVQQQIEVQAQTVQVETTNTQLGEVIETKQITSLPLNGRSYIDLLGLQAGVVPVTSNASTSNVVSGQLAAGNISVNGQRESSNQFLVNGGDVSEGRNFGAAIVPNLDSVAEFRLITNSFDAEYGRFSGGVMNAITKSGNNAFHGTVFEFLRNNDLDSRGFFDPVRASLKRNQFGYAAGGPAIKNKLFWFSDYQGTRQVQGASTGLVQVPSVAQRGGQFNPVDLNAAVSGPSWAKVLSQRLGYSVSDNEPYSTPSCATTAQCVFPGGIIPARAFSPAAVGTLKYIPLPNQGVSGYAASGANTRINDDKIGERVDLITKSTGNWYMYYHYDNAKLRNPLGGSSFSGFPTMTPSRAQQAVLSNTKTFGASAVNEFRLSFLRDAITRNVPTDPDVALSSLGFVTGINTLGIVPSLGAKQGVPVIATNEFTFGRAISASGQYNNTYAIADSFSKVIGSHSWKFGGEFRYLQINERQPYASNGDFSFDGSETGSDYADFLLGAPAQYIQASLQVLDSRTRYGALFAQDSWRLRPNLTLNYGLRWEVSMPWYDTQNKIQTLVPGQQSTVFPTAPTGLVFPGDKGIPSTLAPTRWKDFSPRLGLAYSPSASNGLLGKLLGGPNKTSIRAAFGIYYTAIEDQTLFVEVADAPYGLYWVSIAPPLFEQPFLTRADGTSQTQRFPFSLPAPGSPAIKNLDFSVFLPITSSPGYRPDNVLPYAEHFNLSVQRQFSGSMVATLAYVGTAGHHLDALEESNPGNPGLCLSLRGSGVQKGTVQCGPNQENTIFTQPNGSMVFGTRSPFGINFGQNDYETTIANSIYNSFQATLERRATDFSFLAAYTYGKCITDSSDFGQRINFTNNRLSRSLCQFDVRHNFVTSYQYFLPFQKMFRNAPRRLTEGWDISGISRFATGFPVTLSESGDRSLTGAPGIDTPNYIGGLVIQNPRDNSPQTGRPNQYFNKGAFTAEVLGTFGTANRAFFHGPGFDNWDMSLHKTTPIRERMEIQFRAEYFNVFNHAQFNNPNGNFASGNFGRVTSVKNTVPARIGQLSLKFLW